MAVDDAFLFVRGQMDAADIDVPIYTHKVRRVPAKDLNESNMVIRDFS